MQEQCSRMRAIIFAMSAGSIRARVRAEMTAEIKAVARQHLEKDGANLSLRAVAKDMGMVSSALFRYFKNRDDLLTALILDAYNALGDAVESADAAVTDRSQLRARWLAATRTVRGWALARPAEYALIYGSPVPGYAAPPDTIAAAARTPVTLARILADGHAAGTLSSTPLSAMARDDLAAQLTQAVRADLARTRDDIAPGLPEEVLLLGITSWIQVFGSVSLELFGQFNNVIDAREEFFDQQMELMADLVGLRRTR
jgi:AcrR family transcriptional regulator